MEQFRSDPFAAVQRHPEHPGRIGGALTILVHLGQFFNPENRQMLGVYHGMLKACREAEAVSETDASLVSRMRNLSGD